MPRMPWMFTGDIQPGMTYTARPGVTNDRYSHAADKLWRYMPLDRFLGAVERRKLFFTRLSTYVRKGIEPFEGSSPASFPRARDQVLAERGQLEEFKLQQERYEILKLQTVVVNCWHKSENETRFLWKVFCDDAPAAAIVTRFDRLIDSMPEPAIVGCVEYVNYETYRDFYAGSNPFANSFMKSHDLEYEREVRAVMWDEELKTQGWGHAVESDGFEVSVNLEKLIEAVVVNSMDNIAVVQNALDTAGLSVRVEPSVTLRKPYY